MTKGRGSGKAPERVVGLLKKAVAEKSQSAVSKETGLGLATVNALLKGNGEPTTATLQKLATYFGVTVAWLRGEEFSPSVVDLAERLSTSPEDVQKYMHVYGGDEKDEKKWNVQKLTKFFKALSLPEQQNVAWIAEFIVRLDLEHQQQLITSVMKHYGHFCRSLPSDTEEE